MFKNLRKKLKKINSISTPIGGVGWDNKQSEKKIVYNLLQYLTGRRILKYNHGIINRQAAILSLTETRQKLTETIQSLEIGTPHLSNLLIFRTIIENLQTALENSAVDQDGNLVLNDEDLNSLYLARKMLNDYLGPINISDESFKQLLLKSGNNGDFINL